jgi:hypothetical protein
MMYQAGDLGLLIDCWKQSAWFCVTTPQLWAVAELSD